MGDWGGGSFILRELKTSHSFTVPRVEGRLG
jgi:hypothetical protein